jgi:hypothetical protein
VFFVEDEDEENPFEVGRARRAEVEVVVAEEEDKRAGRCPNGRRRGALLAVVEGERLVVEIEESERFPSSSSSSA